MGRKTYGWITTLLNTPYHRVGENKMAISGNKFVTLTNYNITSVAASAIRTDDLMKTVDFRHAGSAASTQSGSGSLRTRHQPQQLYTKLPVHGSITTLRTSRAKRI